MVSKQHFGQQKAVLRPSGSEIDVQEAVVVHVTEIGPHGRVHLVQMHFGRHVFECSVFHVLEQLQRLGTVGKSEITSQGFIGGEVVAIDEQVRPAIIVVVEEPAGEALAVGYWTPAFCATSVNVRS